MKYSRIGGFEKHLQGASPSNFSELYLIVSKDEEERKAAINLLLAEFLKSLKVEPIILSAKKTLEKEIFCELETFCFLNPKKVILLKDADELEKSALERLALYFAKPTKGVYLILSMASISAKSQFYKNAEKYGVVLEILEEKPWEKEKTVLEILAKEAAAAGKKMPSDLLQAFIKGVGTETALLINEFKKLFCYVGERVEITREDLQAICSTSFLETSWQLGEALFHRKPAQALKIVRGILSQEVHFILILKQLRSQFQTVFQVGSTLRENIRQEFPAMKEFVIEKNLKFAESYGLSNLPSALKILDEVEFMAKNGMDQYDFLADLLIFKLTAI